MPYEELNGSQVAMISNISDSLAINISIQNKGLDHGKCRVIKDLSHTKPDLSSSKQILDRLVSLAASSEIGGTVILEFFPFKKVQSIPNGTCAFQRLKCNNGIAAMTWKNNTPENLELARSIARELASIIANAQEKYIGRVKQGYGNYGTSVLVLILIGDG